MTLLVLANSQADIKLTNLRRARRIIFDDLTEAEKMTKVCDKDTCQAPHLCISIEVCKCTDGYITTSDSIFCDYQQKCAKKAKWLEAFLPSLGHFYTGRVLCAICKLLVLILCVLTSRYVFNDDGKSVIRYSFLSLFILALILWHMMDVYRFFSNKYSDGNGNALFDC